MRNLFILILMVFCVDVFAQDVNLYAASIWELYRREGFKKYPYKGPEGGNSFFIGYGTKINSVQYNNYKRKGITMREAKSLVRKHYQNTYDIVCKEFGHMYAKNILLAITNVCYNVGWNNFKYSNGKTTTTYNCFKRGDLLTGIYLLREWNKFDKNRDGKTENHEISSNLKKSRDFDFYLAMGNIQMINKLSKENFNLINSPTK